MDQSMFPVWIVLSPLLLVPIVIIIRSIKQKRIRERIASGDPIEASEFEKNWISQKGVGYKYNDQPGCYVITIYSSPLNSAEDYNNYDDIYVGQSVHICQRVHNHLNGKGNGDVYADVKAGKNVYVRLVPCEQKEMNRMEKELIAAFHATKSYNNTKGGGIKRS